MNVLSDKARALLNELFGLWRQWIGRKAGMTRCLRQLRGLREPATIPSLLWLLNDHDSAVAGQTALALDEITRHTPAILFPAIDERIRASYGLEWPEGAQVIKPGDVAWMRFSGETATALGWISCHPSGYVREQAVLRLDREITDGREIPFLLLRIDDWVGSVRSAAGEALRRRIAAPHRGIYLKNLPLVVRLQQRSRGRETRAFGDIKRLLQSNLKELILSAMESGDQTSQLSGPAWAWEIASMGDAALQRLVVDPMLASTNPTARIRATSWIASNQAALELQRQILPELLKDRLTAVRRVALGWCATTDPTAHRATLQAALLDPSPIIRSIAQFHLPKLESLDLRNYYEQALAHPEPRRRKAAIAGLGETGRAADARLVAPFASVPQIGVRKVALAALARLAPKEYLELFLTALQDESPGVCGQARRALETQATSAGTERLAAIFAQTHYRHVRLQTLALINVLPKWDALPLLIRIHGDPNDLVRSAAASHLNAWLAGFNRTHQVQPSNADLARFREALEIFSAILPNDMARELRGLESSLRAIR